MGGNNMDNQKQVDNLIELLDGYVQKGGHHLNVNVFTKETLKVMSAFLYVTDITLM